MFELPEHCLPVIIAIVLQQRKTFKNVPTTSMWNKTLAILVMVLEINNYNIMPHLLI